MTDDFLNLSATVTDSLRSLLTEAEQLKMLQLSFERGEIANLKLSVGNSIVFNRDFKSNCAGEVVKQLFRNESERIKAKIAECVYSLQTLLESEEK